MDKSQGADAPVALRGLAILVVEDEYFLATEISRKLRKAGAAVVGPFPTVEDALRAVDGGSALDAALLDVNLRGDMVYRLADRLRERGTPFVFMTGYDKAALPPAYRDVPLCDKPINVEDFVRHIAGVPSGA